MLAFIAKFFLGAFQGFHSDPDFLLCLSLRFWWKVLVYFPLKFYESVLPLSVEVMSADLSSFQVFDYLAGDCDWKKGLMILLVSEGFLSFKETLM